MLMDIWRPNPDSGAVFEVMLPMDRYLCGIVIQRNGLAHIQHKPVHFRPHKKRQYTALRALLSGTSLHLLDFNVWRSAIFSDQITFTNIFSRPCGKFVDAI